LPIDLDSGLDVKIICKNCGSWRRIPPDTFMLTEPRCAVCGSVMTPEPEGANPPDSGASTDQPFANTTAAEPTVAEQTDSEIDTEAWINQLWQEVAGQSDQPAQTCPDCGAALDSNACPICGYPDEPLRRRIGRVMMAIAKALRTRHPNCRKSPCAQCRQVVARMNAFVISDDLSGLIQLWREVTGDGDQALLSP